MLAIRADKNGSLFRLPVGHAGPTLADRLKFSDWHLLEVTTHIFLIHEFWYLTTHTLIVGSRIN